ncbi:alpha/beta hydrolase family protein [Aurantiacibacter gangjinensis]|uniref:Uncharacterized protein n=1 Tax=Aurantiacibacter gangjinensis TaxID=502682 RepID=A0A0G9MP99_9SPHN|nr:alpha/beta fold hydrolase [Aurantiacibacter gangjinensis]APE28300.1 Prolyl oligopeptidase family protein [Aurantiacibacter gangjinensis]KLE32540.1 hypothetical protein AAW01_00240 [Aurantiacibacter gangjinensis]
MKFAWVAACAALAIAGPFSITTHAQEAEAASAIPAEIPTSAFAAQSQLRGAQLSPDGTMFALTSMQGGELYALVMDAETRQLVNGVKLGDQDEFNWFNWVGNNHLVFSVRLEDTRRDYTYSRLLAFELSTQTMQPLVRRNLAYDGDSIIHYDHDNAAILVAMQFDVFTFPDVYRFDLANMGADEDPPEARRVHNRDESIVQWITDNEGVIRMGVGFNRGGRVHLRYRSSEDDRWDTVARTRLDSEDAFDNWDIRGLRAGRDTAYVITKPEGADRDALMEIDLSTGELGEVVYASETEDVSEVYFNDEGDPIAVGYSGDSFRREWIDPDLRRWRDMLGDALPGSRVTILDVSDDEDRMLILQSGPADPGALYVFTPSTSALDLFGEYRPRVPAGLLTEPRSIRYEARDGLSIHAYLTLPKGRGEEDLPLIVYPHGGPYGVRDTDRYNDMVQLLANRGYAVIQPNYRGSGGYGEAFELMGNGQIGRAMQDDLDDAVAHLVAEGIVDPERVCILGSSYGGYAAMWGAIRNPEIYRCAASFAGVSHFERQLAHDRDYLFGRNRGRWWNRVDGNQSNFDLDDVSPAVQVARLTRPLLLVHGEEDDIVPHDQYRLMVSRAESAGVEIETLSFPDAGHGFDTPEDEQRYYDTLLAFLARHNPAD